MTPHSLNPENLIDLADELRLAGYTIGTQQYIAAQNLFILLAAHGRVPEDPRKWRTLLAPIFCSSPGEQEDFYKRFNQWLRRHSELIAKIGEAQPASKEFQSDSNQIEKPIWFHLRHRPKFAIAIGLSLLFIITVTVYLAVSSPHVLTGIVAGDDGNAIANAQVSFLDKSAKSDDKGRFSINYEAKRFDAIVRGKTATLKVEHPDHDPDLREVKLYRPDHQQITLRKPVIALPTVMVGSKIQPLPEETPLPQSVNARPPFNWFNILFVTLPLLLGAVWMLFRWFRRRMLLRKLRAAGEPNVKRITVKGAAEHLFRGQTFRRVVQELRRHRQAEATDLDVARTVRATIRRGGLFTPFYGLRQMMPEYLLLIDRASVHDEQARLGDELFNRLRANGVFVDRYYFQTDPRACRNSEPDSPTFTLHDLAARYHNHCVFIFGDGAGLISPYTGEPENWLNDFLHWPHRVLLTPEASQNWGYRERSIEECDFTIVPATKDGLAAFTETIATGVRPNLNGDYSHPFPEMIKQRPKRWLEQHEPQGMLVERLCEHLKDYLGDEGWFWLSACAIYPALSWDITLFLGFKLLGAREDFEERLLALVRLPWFRYGTMPDWLRSRLIASFDPEQSLAVRHTIEGLLISALEQPNDGFDLEIAISQKGAESHGLRQLLRNLITKAIRWRRDLLFSDFLRNVSEESPLRDYVFLAFMSGRQPRKLAMTVPEILRSILFPKGQHVLGIRPAVALLLAALMSFVSWLAVSYRSPVNVSDVRPQTTRPPVISEPSVTPQPNIAGRAYFDAKDHIDHRNYSLPDGQAVNCIFCHKPTKREGMTIPSHTECYVCHAPASGVVGADHQTDCIVCHTRQVQRLRPFLAKYASRAYGSNFSHRSHLSYVNGNCQACHTISGNYNRPRPRTIIIKQHYSPGPARGRSCFSCHDDEIHYGREVFGGDDASRCDKCHDLVGDIKVIPKSGR